MKSTMRGVPSHAFLPVNRHIGIKATGPQTPLVYKAIWFWDEERFLSQDITGIGFQGNDIKDNKPVKLTSRPVVDKTVDDGAISFTENIDRNQQKIYKLKHQRQIASNVPNVVTIQDVKDVVTYLSVNAIPDKFLSLLHSYEINKFLKSLVLYFQLYLQIWDDLKYRRMSYNDDRLKHPISVKREARCRDNLRQLRCQVGLEYALFVTGEGSYKKYHHMNNPLNISYTTKDVKPYEYLFKFFARIIWISLSRSNFKEIELELSRMLTFPKNYIVRHDEQHSNYSRALIALSKSDGFVLHGDLCQTGSSWDTVSPVVFDIFANKSKPDLFMSKKYDDKFTTELSGREAAVNLPEEMLSRLGLTLGILGQPRDSYEAMLHTKLEPSTVLDKEEEEKASARVDSLEKPTVKMNQFLDELEIKLCLNDFDVSDPMTFTNIKAESLFYSKNHFDDSKAAYFKWKMIKGSSI